MSAREKLLQKARRSLAGWTAQDVDRLYKAWGFVVKKTSSKHTIYGHPDFPDITAAVTRSSGEISKGYVTDAIEAIEEVIARSQQP
jgi:predicted RNA binding protein YcfA (HicA-like mRNA interferase family)